ncbi:hypothetical protein TI04_12925 [Achromatium sp. WMS2]|nr:hypothetical protein TI04_12925 [Achromatium sp. WMS2]
MAKTTSLLQGIAVALLGSLAASPQQATAAVIADHSGTICKNYNASDVSYIDYYSNGTVSKKSTSTLVVCPLARNTSGVNGAYVYVDLSHSGTLATTCTAYSYSYTGVLKASGSKTFTGSGFGELSISLVGAGKSDAWSNYSVICTIPGGSAARVLGVALLEQ